MRVKGLLGSIKQSILILEIVNNFEKLEFELSTCKVCMFTVSADDEWMPCGGVLVLVVRSHVRNCGRNKKKHLVSFSLLEGHGYNNKILSGFRQDRTWDNRCLTY